MSEEKTKAEDLAGALADTLQKDTEAEQELRADPVKFFEEHFGGKLPKGMRVEIRDSADKVRHVFPGDRRRNCR